MIIGVIGSGGREHAITKFLSFSKKVNKIYCFPGNAGTENIATNIEIDLNDFEKLRNFIEENKIDLVVVGPEQPLVDGITDYLQKFNIKVFGPNKIASQLEGSKIFTKKLCEKYNIPTAKFGIFTNSKDTLNYLDQVNYPIVIKADNLASGKGVYICNTKDEAIVAVEEIFNGKFGEAKNILLEEFLNGEEMSFFIITDGTTIKNFGTAQDHKRVLEGDKGKNTGGMGAYSPSRLYSSEIEKKILDRIIKPTLKGLNDLGTSYQGFLYAGLMIVNNDPYLIEYNVRMGDPECQTILPRLKTDLFEIINSCVNEDLKSSNIEWKDEKSVCIVLCSKGYPEKFEKNVEIKNLEKLKLKNNSYIFHAGTKKIQIKICATGGRVLNFVSLSENFSSARKEILENLNYLNWENGFYRKDIAHKVIK